MSDVSVHSARKRNVEMSVIKEESKSKYSKTNIALPKRTYADDSANLSMSVSVAPTGPRGKRSYVEDSANLDMSASALGNISL